MQVVSLFLLLLTIILPRLGVVRYDEVRLIFYATILANGLIAWFGQKAIKQEDEEEKRRSGKKDQ